LWRVGPCRRRARWEKEGGDGLVVYVAFVTNYVDASRLFDESGTGRDDVRFTFGVIGIVDGYGA